MSERRCLVFDPAEESFADIEACLAMLQIDFLLANSLSQALEMAKENGPDFVLCRYEVESNMRLAKELSDEFFKYEGLCDIPIIVMDEPAVIEAAEGELSLFKGALELPVEFPNFPARLAQILEMETPFEANSRSEALRGPNYEEHKKEDSAPSAAELLSPELSVGESNGSGPAPSEGQQRRMIVAHAVMLKVMEKLQQDKGFAEAPLEQLPEFVEQTASQVCRELDLERLFG